MRPALLLASASPRRREILRGMKIPFKVVKSRYKERPMPHLSPARLVRVHAEAKARGAVIKPGARFVLGADTIVWAGGKALGKPGNFAEARRMLQRLSGKKHYVYTGLALWDVSQNRMRVAVEKTAVFIKKLSPKLAADYPEKINALDKAGAYAIQERPKIVRRIKGSYSNVVGLPKELLRKMLRQAQAASSITRMSRKRRS